MAPFVLAVAFAVDLGASAVARAEPGRPWKEVMADVIEALGGRGRLAKHVSLHEKVKVSLVAQNMSGVVETWATRDGKALRVTNIATMPEIREGTDGKRAWSQDPINGLRVLEDVEAEQARVEAAWNAELRMKELFPTIEAKNEPGEEGAPYFECLVLTPKPGASMTECFDPRTHLMVRQRGSRSSPQGNTPFVARMRDWRAVGDIKMPFVTEMQVGPLSFVGTITSAELDVPVDASLFAVPDVSSPAGGGAGAAARAIASATRTAARTTTT